MKKKIKIGECYSLFKKYGDLSLNVKTPFGYKHIEACDVTAHQSSMIMITTNNNKKLICSPNHRVKVSNGRFVHAINLIADKSKIITTDGIDLLKSVVLLDDKLDLLDIQVADVQQYYSNGILSHNSTILKLISYMLFGNTLETESKMKFGDLRFVNNRNGATYTNGHIVIEANGEYYGIKKKTEIIKNKSGEISGAPTIISYYVLANPDDEMTDDNVIDKLDEDRKLKTQKKISEIIGSYDNFKRIVLTTSDTLNNILKNNMADFIDSLLYDSGLDIFDKKLEGQKIYSKTINSKSRVTCNIEATNINSTNLLEEIKKIEGEILEIETVALPNIIGNIEKGKIFVEEHIKKLYKIDPEIYGLNVDETKKTIGLYSQEVIKLKTRKTIIEKEIETLTDVYDEKRLNELLEKKENHKINENTYKFEIKNIERKIADEDHKIALINGVIHRLKEEGTKLKEEAINFKNSKICPTCGQKMTEVHNTHINALIEKKKNEMLEIVDRIKLKESEKEVPYDYIQKYKDEIENIGDKITSSTLEMEEILVEIGILTNEKNDVEKHKTLKINLEQIPQSIENWELKISILNERVKNHENSLKQIEDNRNNESRIEAGKKRLSNLEGDEKENLENILIKKSLIGDKQGKIRNNNNLIKEFEEQEYQDMVLNLYKKCVHRDGIPKQMLNNYIIPKINVTLQNILSTVHFKVWLDEEDLRPKLVYTNRPNAIIDCISASGKERTFAAIVLKFALNQINVKSKPQFFLLDEVMGKLSEDSVEEFIELLQLIKNNMRRVLIIEHNAEVNPDHLINVTVNEDGISTAEM